MNKTTNGKTLLKLEIKELCNERKPPLEIPYSFPSLLEENLENSAPEEKISMITNYLKQQKQSYQDYRKLEQRLLEKEHKKEKFLLKYNTFDGFPKHPKVFHKRIKEQEIFSYIPFQSSNNNNNKESQGKKQEKNNELGLKNKSNQMSNGKPWNYITQYSNYFDQMSSYRNGPLPKVKPGKTQKENKTLWENFTHPNQFFVKEDVNEWDFNIKRVPKKVGVFTPPTYTGGFFDKTIRDYE